MKHSHSFRKLTQTAQKIAETPEKKSKIAICADYFSTLKTDEELNLAARFLVEGPFPSRSNKHIAISSRTYSICASDFCQLDYEAVFVPCKAVLGSASETIEKLMANVPSAREKRFGSPLSLRQVDQIFEHLGQSASTKEKKNLLWKSWTKMAPTEIKYFIRILSGEPMGIGFTKNDLISALAYAFKRDPIQVRKANMLIQNMGQTAVLCKHNTLHQAAFRLFNPLPFMSASFAKKDQLKNLKSYIAEQKINGLRVQCHVSGQKIRIYSKDLKEVSFKFPDILQSLLNKNMPETVLEGEICIYKNQELLPLSEIQKRMKYKKPNKKVLTKLPALFVAFDLLYFDNSTLFDRPFTERRQQLEKLSKQYQLPVARQFQVENFQQMDELFLHPKSPGSEPLIFKKREGIYDYGMRSKSWLKIRSQKHTLKAVVMYAHRENPAGADSYSHFTLGVTVRDDQRKEDSLVPIGKATGNFSKPENKFNNHIENLTVEKYGSTFRLLPKLVVEVEFDDIRQNKRAKANYTLLLPRIRRICWNFNKTEINSLKDIEGIYNEKMNRSTKSKPFIYY